MARPKEHGIRLTKNRSSSCITISSEKKTTNVSPHVYMNSPPTVDRVKTYAGYEYIYIYIYVNIFLAPPVVLAQPESGSPFPNDFATMLHPPASLQSGTDYAAMAKTLCACGTIA